MAALRFFGLLLALQLGLAVCLVPFELAMGRGQFLPKRRESFAYGSLHGLTAVLMGFCAYRLWGSAAILALPASFVLFPLTGFAQLAAVRRLMKLDVDGEGWELAIVPLSLLYCLPWLALTGASAIISLLIF